MGLREGYHIITMDRKDPDYEGSVKNSARSQYMPRTLIAGVEALYGRRIDDRTLRAWLKAEVTGHSARVMLATLPNFGVLKSSQNAKFTDDHRARYGGIVKTRERAYQIIWNTRVICDSGKIPQYKASEDAYKPIKNTSCHIRYHLSCAFHCQKPTSSSLALHSSHIFKTIYD